MRYDVISIALLVLFILDALNGYRRGLVKVALDFLGTIIAIYAAFLLYRPMGAFIGNFFLMATVVQNVVGFVVVMILVAVLINIIQFLLGIVVKLPGLSILNRVFGAIFSFLKTYFVLALIFAIVFSMGFYEVNNTIIQSKIGYKMLESGKSIYLKFHGILPSADDLIPKDWDVNFFLNRATHIGE